MPNCGRNFKKKVEIILSSTTFLGVNVFIVEKESDKKTIYAASKNWQSTYAVKQKTALYITSRLNNRNVYGLEQMPNSS